MMAFRSSTCLAGGAHGRVVERRDHVYLELDQVRRGLGQAPIVFARTAALDRDVLPVDVPEFPQRLLECRFRPCTAPEDKPPDPGDLPWLLPFGGDRRGEEAAHRRDERPSPHY
jgi:hypothetical protein